MWSKSKKSRFDLTLNGRNVVKERAPSQLVHTAPGRGYNSRQLRYVDIRDLLQGSYSQSWRLENSRKLTTARLDPLPVQRDVDRINDFLSRSAEPRLERDRRRAPPPLPPPPRRTPAATAAAAGSRLRVPNGTNTNPNPDSTGRSPRADRNFRSPTGSHDQLEEEYRALRDLTRTDPRYIEPSSGSEYINFVEPKPLHSSDYPDADENEAYLNPEDDLDSYYGEDATFTEMVPPPDCPEPAPGDTAEHAPNEDPATSGHAAPTQAPSGESGGGGGGGGDLQMISTLDLQPKLAPIAESAGPPPNGPAEGDMDGYRPSGSPKGTGTSPPVTGGGVVVASVEQDEEAMSVAGEQVDETPYEADGEQEDD